MVIATAVAINFPSHYGGVVRVRVLRLDETTPGRDCYPPFILFFIRWRSREILRFSPERSQVRILSSEFNSLLVAQ